MSRLILVHGSFGNPNENWFPYIKEQFASDEIDVIAPQFPVGVGEQSLDNWLGVWNQEIGNLDSNDVLVGHSIGCAFLLKVLSGMTYETVTATKFVSPFMSLLDNPEFDEVNETFVTTDVDWAKVQANTDAIAIWHGDNDPYVPAIMAQDFAKNLNSTVTFVPEGGHLNETAGFLQFPDLAASIAGSVNQS